MMTAAYNDEWQRHEESDAYDSKGGDETTCQGWDTIILKSHHFKWVDLLFMGIISAVHLAESTMLCVFDKAFTQFWSFRNVFS